MLTLNDVAERYGVSTRTIQRWLARGMFPAPSRYSRRTIRWSAEKLANYDRLLEERGLYIATESEKEIAQ